MNEIPIRFRNVSLLGTGLLGEPIARRLLANGVSLMVWNRTRAKAESLGELGAAVAESASAALRSSPIAMLVLSDLAAIRTVILDGTTAQDVAGRTIICCATIGPDESRFLADEFQARGATWVEAPVLGSGTDALEGGLQVMAGGEAADVARVRPVLERLGTVRHVGPIGSACLLKLALNQLLASLTAAFATSLILVRNANLDVALFMEILRKSSLYAPAFDKKLGKMISGDYGEASSHLENLLKDIELFVSAAEKHGVRTTLPRATAELARRALSLGQTKLDYSALALSVAPDPR